MKTRTFISKSKAGHYTVTLRDEATRITVSQNLLSSLSHARFLVPEMKERLQVYVSERQKLLSQYT